MATLDDLSAALMRADAAGDTQGAKALAAHIKWLQDPAGGNYQPPHNPAADMPSMDPTQGMSTFDKFAAGAGQAVVNTARGLGQMVGLADRGDVAEQRKRDAPLDASTAGKLGNFAGNVGVMAIPTMLAPVAGAGFLASTGINAGVGALAGLAQPSTSTGETLKNAAIGTVAGGAAPAIGRGLQAGYNYGKSFLAPLFESGQQNIAGRTLAHFAGSPQDAQAAATAMQSARPALPGVQPTMGMSSNNAGLATLQRSLANNPDVATAFAARDQGNTNAILDALQKIAGEPGKREMFAADRDAAANVLYGRARANYDPASVTPEMQGSIDALLKRPSITQGSKDAQRIAMEDGRVPSADGSFASLEDVGHSLDDQINALKTAGQTKLAGKVVQTKNQLLDLMDNLSPDYKEARATYAEMSKPINTMDVGQTLLDKLSPALNEYRSQKVLRPSSFAEALAAGDATAQKATGFSGAKMDQVLGPQDMATVKGVGQTLGQVSDAQSLGRALGSPTAQNLIAQDAVRQFAGPLGLPKGFTENTLMQTLMRPQQLVGKYAEPRITQMLGSAALNPQEAATLMRKALTTTDDPRFRNYLARALLLGGRAETAALSQ